MEKVRQCDRERDILESPLVLWYSLFISLNANWPMTEMSQNSLINEPFECPHTHTHAHTGCIWLHVSQLCANKLQMETRSEQSNQEWLIYKQRQSQSCSSSTLNLTFHLQPALNSLTDRPTAQNFNNYLTSRGLWNHCIYSQITFSFKFRYFFLLDSDFSISIYAFSRRFYPKRLTVHSGNTFFCQYVFTFDSFFNG